MLWKHLRVKRQLSRTRGNRQCRSLNNRSECRFLSGAGKKMVGDHPRNTGPMLSSRRCGAKTRSGRPCMSPAVSERGRCRMHGGAPGSGAPRGNKNALKHGRYTREAIAERRLLRKLIRQSWGYSKRSSERSRPVPRQLRLLDFLCVRPAVGHREPPALWTSRAARVMNVRRSE